MRKKKEESNISAKANRILNGILVILILILTRIWHLAVVQHEDKVEASHRPQRKVIIERAERATIRDRFGTSLATNRVQYNAAVSYGGISEIPRVQWKKDASGKKIKHYRRKEYITQLAELLGRELTIDPCRLEDLIHAKASIFGSVPFTIKENITEQEFFHLKMLEKDWPGIHAEKVAKRWYPFEQIGGEVIGYLGAISRPEYEAITSELQKLRTFLSEANECDQTQFPEGHMSRESVESRLKELEGRAYTINDYVGKAGVEGAFDEKLRGLRGKKIYLSDIRGNFLQELPGAEPPLSGSRLYLSLSIELQEYAEKLLAEFEQSCPSERSVFLKRQSLIPEKQPWIKGGSIVVMDPNSGEILALASYPRFNPNDFIRSGDAEENVSKKERIHRWMESESYLASIWNQKRPLERERFDLEEGRYYEESCEMTWENYLNFILPKRSPLRAVLEKHPTLKKALFLQRKIEELTALFNDETLRVSVAKIFDFLYSKNDDVIQGLTLTLQEKEFLQKHLEEKEAEIYQILDQLKPFFQTLPLNYEKLLLIDIYRLAVDSRKFNSILEDHLSWQSLNEYHESSAKFIAVQEAVFAKIKENFHEKVFKLWRTHDFKNYLALKRKEEEKAKKKFGRPYVEYLDEAEHSMFQWFWKTYQWEFLAFFLADDENRFLTDSKLHLFRNMLLQWKKEINDDVIGEAWVPKYRALKQSVNSWDLALLVPYLHTFRKFEDLDRPLLGRYAGLRTCSGVQIEKNLAAAFYPTYGYGFARSHGFRQATVIGSIFKLVPAYEALRQNYLNKGDVSDLNPLTIIDDKHRIGKDSWNVGFTLDGKPIPMFYRGGRVPRSEHAGIGRVDLVRALETSSNPYFALLSGDILEDPEDLCRAANLFGFGEKTGVDLIGEFAGNIPWDVSYNRTGLYAMSIGQHSMVGTPLQTAVMLSAIANGGKILKPKIVSKELIEGQLFAVPTEVRWTIFLPSPIRDLLLTGLKQVVMGDKGTARSLRTLFPSDLISTIVGKTSTAESIERISLDGTSGTLKLKHIWFGAISFEPKFPGDMKKPELVVVVYLRLGDYGRETAPLAVKMIKKWREIKERQQGSHEQIKASDL